MAGHIGMWLPWVGVGLGLAAGLGTALRPRPEWDLAGQVAVITGGSGGLGLLLARELGRQGCQLALCARDGAELARARADLEARGITVHTVRCDVSDRTDVERCIADVVRRYGGIDLLVNNAGAMEVGPVETMTVADFETAMRVNFWGMVYPTLSVLPVMRAQGGGRLVNITSIGGNVSVPHLLPDDCAKFAAVAFSQGLRAELAHDGITVVTVLPGLMRTGSYLTATFKGERAARQLVRAAKRGDSEVILSVPAWLVARLHGLFPGITADVLRVVNQLTSAVPGHEAQPREPSPGRVGNALHNGGHLRQA